MTIEELISYGRGVLGTLDADAESLPNRLKVPSLRSALFIPGNRREWIRKSVRYSPDAVILDLEDAVQPEDRTAARQVVAEEIASLAAGVRAVWVRVNSSPEQLWADLDAAVRPGLTAIQLSKVHSRAAVVELDKMLGFFEGRNGLDYGSVAIVPILETAGGVRNTYDIAMCSRRVEYVGGMVAPEGDIATALRLRAFSDPVGSESLYFRSKVLLEVRAAGISCPMTGVVTDLSPDDHVFRPLAEMNRNLGYAGMLVIHPSHVAVANEIFSPSQRDIERACKVIETIRSSTGRGALRDSGSGGMIDLAMVRFAVLVLEEAIGFGLIRKEDAASAG